jgi:hypothetical protein
MWLVQLLVLPVVLIVDLAYLPAPEGDVPYQHLVQQTAHRPQVALMAQAAAEHKGCRQ